QHDFDALHVAVDQVGILQSLQGDDVALDLGQLGGTDFRTIHGLQRGEAELRQTTVQRLLTTLEARSDGAAGTGGLTLVTTATGPAHAAPDTAAQTMRLATGTRRGSQIVQLHD